MMQRGKLRLSKPMAAMIGLFLCALLMLGGSFAWTDFSQSRTGKIYGIADPDVTLHDEFDGQNKDVFVENTGTQNLYIRVRLDEYMEIGGESFIGTAKVQDKRSWEPHRFPQDGAAADCGEVAGGQLFHSYYKWNVSGAARNYHPGTPGLVYTRLGANNKVDLETGSKVTAAAAAPISMKTYIALINKSNRTADENALLETVQKKGCWILDRDGWAYWSRVLEAGQATNLLLDEVTALRTANDDWYYAIDVKLQAVTFSDFERWDEAGYSKTQEADTLIAQW